MTGSGRQPEESRTGGRGPLRVCLAVGRFYPALGGEERVAELLATRLASAGHAVSVVTQRLPGAAAAERWRGVRIHRAVRPIDRGPLFGPTYAASLGAFLLRRPRAFDVLQATYLYWDAVVAALLKPLLGFRLVVRVVIGGAGGDLDRFRSMRLWPLVPGWDRPTLEACVRLLLRRVDAFVVLNPETRAELLALGVAPGRCHVVPNGLDLDEFRPTPPAPPAGPRRLLTIARLAEQKGLDLLLRALPALQGEVGPVHLRLVGEGPERGRLEALAASLGVAGGVEFAGSETDVRPSLAAAELFVLPSRFEGLPLALLEAMAAGLPVVATAVPGTAEVVRDGMNGLLVPPEDPPALAGALARLVRDPALAARLAAAGRQTVADRYSLAAMVARTLAIFRGEPRGGEEAR